MPSGKPKGANLSIVIRTKDWAITHTCHYLSFHYDPVRSCLYVF